MEFFFIFMSRVIEKSWKYLKLYGTFEVGKNVFEPSLQNVLLKKKVYILILNFCTYREGNLVLE